MGARPAADWGSLPHAVAHQIVLHLVRNQRQERAVARLLAPLALCCKGWRAAIADTLLELSINDARAEPTHWLSSQRMQAVGFAAHLGSQLAADPGLPLQIVSPSAPTLRRLSGLPNLELIRALLPTLRCLSRLDLRCPAANAPQRKAAAAAPPLEGMLTQVDLAHLSSLPALTQLSISGHFQLASLDRLPAALTRLELSSQGRQICLGASASLTLPPSMQLRHLRLKARVVLLSDWPQLCRQARNVRVEASRLVLGVPCATQRSGSGRAASPFWELAEDIGNDLALYKTLAEEVSASASLDQVVLMFQRMQIYAYSASRCNAGRLSSADATHAIRALPELHLTRPSLLLPPSGEAAALSPPSSPRGPAAAVNPWAPVQRPAQHEVVAAWVDGFEMLAALREELVGSHLVSTFYSSSNFGSDEQAPDDVASVLWVERQQAEKRFCFLTPATQKEREMLLRTPVAALEWCPDTQALALLHQPAFLAHSASTLRMLGPIPLTPGLDLSVFPHLKELHGLLQQQPTLAAPLHLQAAPAPGATSTSSSGIGTTVSHLAPIRLPQSVSVLGLQAWEGQAPGFNSTVVAGLSSLVELRLGSFATHDLRALPPSVTMVTLTNPRTTAACPVLGPGNILLPSWGSNGSGGSSQSSSLEGATVGSSSSQASGRFLRRLGAWLSTEEQQAECEAATVAGRSGSFSSLWAKAVGPSKWLHEQRPIQPGTGSLPSRAAAAAPQGRAALRGPALHLHITSSTATQLAVDVSWALRQPALRRYTVSGSQVWRDQVVWLHLSGGGVGSKAAPCRRLLRELAAAPGLECLTVLPNLAAVTFQSACPKVLQSLGFPPSEHSLVDVMSRAARQQAEASRKKARGSRRATGTAGAQCGSRSSAPSWRVESWAVDSFVTGSGEGGDAEGLAWAEGVLGSARGLRVLSTAAAKG
ncbi:hypothetical protein N2152v2_003848 [Parachlorella kessleri]